MLIRTHSLNPYYRFMITNHKIKKSPFFLSLQLPLKWVLELSKLNPTAFKVGTIVAYLVILLKKREISLTSKKLMEFGVSADQKKRALKDLENSGLISQRSLHGKNPIVRVNFIGEYSWQEDKLPN